VGEGEGRGRRGAKQRSLTFFSVAEPARMSLLAWPGYANRMKVVWCWWCAQCVARAKRVLVRGSPAKQWAVHVPA